MGLSNFKNSLGGSVVNVYKGGAVKKLLNWPFFRGKIYCDKRKPPQASRKDQDTENIRAREAQEQERRV